MNSGMPARAAAWAATRTGATTAGAAMLASAAVRNRSDIDSAQAPYVPTLLSRMISSRRSRVCPPNASATSASPSSCRHPVTTSVVATVKPAAGNDGRAARPASQ